MARPTKYNSELQKKADSYLDHYEDDGDVIPSVVGLATFLDVAASSLYLWRDKYDEFSETLAKIEGRQHQKALNSGLDGTFNATITKLVLANHGYHEKQHTELTGAAGAPVETITRVIVRPHESKD